MNRKYILYGLILIILALFSASLFSTPLNLVNVSFEKTSYSVVEDSSLKINYTLENNNNTSQDLLVYAFCDEDRLSCDFSKTFKILGNSTIKSSFTVNAIDDGVSTVKFFVKDMVSNDLKEFTLRVDVERYNDDGKFEVELSRYSFCNDKSQEAFLVFDRVISNDFYTLSLSSDTIFANIKGSNNRYLKRDVQIPLQIETINSNTGNHKITLEISNGTIISKKVFDVYVSQCQEVLNPEFTVTGVLSTTHLIKKEEPYKLNFVIKNISSKNKHIFISQDSNSSLNINFSNREVRLSPGESKEISITFKAPKEMSSGDYPVLLSFFDERTTTNRNLKFLISPESNLNIRLLQSSFVLEIGKNYDLIAVIENKGDVLETVYFDMILSNDIRVNNMTDRITVSPNTNTTVVFSISAGPNTLEKVSQIELATRNSSNSYSKRFILDVSSFRVKDFFKIELLSFPKELLVDVNGSKEFAFEVYNFDDRDVVISRIDITGLPQELSYEITQYTYVPKKSSRVISGKLISGETTIGDYNATIVFYSNTGAILSKPVLIKVSDMKVEYEDEGKYPITGFFTLGKSILLGIILLSIILILLFSLGVIRTKHKNYVRN